MSFDPNRFRPQPKPPPTPKKAPKRIKPKSEKRSREDTVYHTLREVFLKDNVCPITGDAATEVHHTYSGKDRATHYLNVKTWIAVSRDGHNWIHDNPKKSRELGYLK